MKKYVISVIVIICSFLYAVNPPVEYETEWELVNTPSIPALGPFEDFGRTKRGQVFEWVLTPVSSPGLDREYYVNGPKAGQPTGSTSPVVVTFEPPEAKGKGIPQRWGRYTWTRTFKGSWVSRQKDANGGNLKGEQNQLVSGTVMVTGGRNNPDPENGVGDPSGGAIKPPVDDAPDLNDPDCTNPFTPEIADPFENPDERESVDLEEPSQVELIAENILTFKDKVGFDTFVTSEPPKKYLTMSGKTELGGDHNAESPVGGTFVDKKDRATGQRIRTAQTDNPSYYGYNIEGAEKTEISIISMHEVDDYDDCPNHEPDEPGIMKVELTLSEEYTTQMMKQDVVSHSHDFNGEGYYRQETPNAEWQSHNDETLFAYAKTKYKIRVPEDVPRPYQAIWVEEFTPKDEDPDDDVYPDKKYEFKSTQITGDESQTYTIDPADSSEEGTWQVRLLQIEVQVKDDSQGQWVSTDELKVAKWEKAFDGNGFRNEHPEGFAGSLADVDRFRIRMNTQDLPEAYRRVYISTKGSTENEYNDDPTEVLLELDEDPYGSSDGFVSKPIILVADTVDNKFKNDNSQNDQTHIAALGSKVEFRIKNPSGGVNTTVSVKKKKVVYVDLILLWQGGNGPSQFALDNMADDIKIAKEIYAQVGIDVIFWTGAYQVNASVDLSDGLTLDTNPGVLHPEGEAILNAFGTPNNQADVVGLYVDGNIYTAAGPNGEVNGISFWDNAEVLPHAINPIFYHNDTLSATYKGTFLVKTLRSNKAVLAHELGHVLSLLHPSDEKIPEHRTAKRNLLEGGGISYTGSYQTDNKRFMLFQEERMHSSQFVKNPQN